MKRRLLLIDANSLVHRAWHALPPFTTSKGEAVGAVYGVLLALFKALKEVAPSHAAAAFDTKAPTFRHEKYGAYKATRQEVPDELYGQIPQVKKALAALGVPVVERDGFEADDVIGTLAKKAPKDAEVVILTSDMDLLALVDARTKVLGLRRGMQDTSMFSEKEVAEKFGGILPEQVADYKGLAGDSSDNIPGVAGVGPKTASSLLAEYGTLEGVYENISAVAPQTASKLKGDKDAAFLSRDLAKIVKNVPLQTSFGKLEWRCSAERAADYLREKEFRALLARLGELTGTDSPSEGEPVKDKIRRLKKEGVLSAQLADVELRLVPLLRAMEEAGVAVDKKRFSAMERELSSSLAKLERRIYKLAGEEFNINSPRQLSEVLFEKLALSRARVKKTPGGAVSTAAQELEKLEGAHPIVADLLKYREAQKLMSTYVLPLPRLADAKGRVHTHYDQLGTATGRLSSSSPNLQNIPVLGEWGPKIRSGFVAKKGFSFLALDYSQMELRIAAHIANEPTMKAAFEAGEDIHRVTAATVFGVKPEEVNEDMRYRAKALNFGVLYGMGRAGFARTAGIAREEAEAFIEDYFARFPAVASYVEAAKEAARQRGYAETIFGRRRYIPEIQSRAPQLRAAAERVAVNMPVQGTAADIMKMAMLKVADSIKAEEARALLQIHDELLLECPSDTIQRTAQKAKNAMEQAASLSVPLLVKASGGPSWGELTPL